MSFADFLQRMLTNLEDEEEPEEMSVVPMMRYERAHEICMRERQMERLAAEHDGVHRVEIKVAGDGCFGTLRFHPDDGHLHGMLWAERMSGMYVAYPFAGHIQPGDPEALIARLDELGTPYQRPGFEDPTIREYEREDRIGNEMYDVPN